MTAPNPKTLSQEIGEDLHGLLRESDQYRDPASAEVVAIGRKIEKLKKVDRSDALAKQGALASLCGRIAEVHEAFRQASFLPGDTHSDFWTSFANVGDYKKAQELAQWLLVPMRGYFPNVWRKAASFGNILAVANSVTLAQRTFPELADIDFAKVTRAADVMRSHGLTDSQIVAVLGHMGEILRNHGVGYHGEDLVWTIVQPADDSPYLHFRVPVDVSYEELSEMNRELCRAVVERMPNGVYPPGLTTAFSKAQKTEATRIAA